MSDQPWDPGLQNERTRLAWQRTMLAGLTASLLIARLLATTSFVLAVVLGLLALLCTAGLGWLGISRFRRQNAALHSGAALADGRAPGLITVVMVITAVGAALYVLLDQP